MDLLVEGNEFKILRLNRKWLRPAKDSAGEVLGYYESNLNETEFKELAQQAGRALKALGVKRGICMLDFIHVSSRNSELFAPSSQFCFLEVGLRPGGDCLPMWSKYVNGYEPVHAATLVSVGLPFEENSLFVRRNQNNTVALHLMAPNEGVLASAQWDLLKEHPWVLAVEPYYIQGKSIRSETGSYQDLILGAALVKPYNQTSLQEVYKEIYAVGEFVVTPFEETLAVLPRRETVK